MRPQRRDHTLGATALVHEAIVKLGWADGDNVPDQANAVPMAVRAMRHILVDHARRVASLKRKAPGDRVTLQLLVVDGPSCLDVIEIDDAMCKLEKLDERMALVAEMRVFDQMSNQEVADALGISTSTVSSDWKMARAWLARELELDTD